MPAPRRVARFTTTALNKGTRFIAPWAPGWAVAIHRGRRSSRVFRTPAAGGCEFESGGRRYELAAPQVYRDDNAVAMPPAIRFMLRSVINAPEFLRLDLAGEPGGLP